MDMTTYDIERRDAGHWHGDLGARTRRRRTTGWRTIEGARCAVERLRALGPDWLGIYRLVEHDTRRVVELITLAKNPAAVVFGALGGRAKSARKTLAMRANARRPRQGLKARDPIAFKAKRHAIAVAAGLARGRQIEARRAAGLPLAPRTPKT